MFFGLSFVGAATSWAAQVSVRIVSDPPGAVLFTAVSGGKSLGALPLELTYRPASPWRACVSYAGVRARWPNGEEVIIRRIELCPEDGAAQEVRIALPHAQIGRQTASPKLVAAAPSASQISSPTVVCQSAGLAYKPLAGNCGNSPAMVVGALPLVAHNFSTGPIKHPAVPTQHPNSGGGHKWQAFGEALSGFAQGWAQAVATSGVYSPPASLDVPQPAPQRPTQLSSNRFGPFAFFNSSNGVSGTANRIGNFTYYSFSDGTTGTSNRIGQFTFHNFSNGSTTVTGSTTDIGTFQFHNFSDGTSGTSSRIGDFTFHSFTNGTNCTTTRIGTFLNTTCN